MKWRIIHWGSIPVSLVLFVTGLVFREHFWSFLTASLLFDAVYILTRKQMIRESIAAQRNKMRNIVRRSNLNYRLVDAADYPRDYVADFDEAQQELEKIGFRAKGDLVYFVIDEFRLLAGKSFIRAMSNSAGTIWAVIFRLNPPWYTRFVFRLLGMGKGLQCFSSVNIAFDDGRSIEIINLELKLVERLPPSLLKIQLPGASPWEMMQRLAEERIKYESAHPGIKALALPTLNKCYAEIRRTELATATYQLHQSTPTLEEMLKHGFSREEAEQYLVLYREVIRSEPPEP